MFEKNSQPKGSARRPYVPDPRPERERLVGAVAGAFGVEVKAPEAPAAAADPYSWTPEQVEACRAETESLKQEAAKLRAETLRLRERFEAAQK